MLLLDTDHIVIIQQRAEPEFNRLVHRYTLLSRNLVDFQKVPGLVIEDWTRP